jgi:hypothetical protein
VNLFRLEEESGGDGVDGRVSPPGKREGQVEWWLVREVVEGRAHLSRKKPPDLSRYSK